jgi:hypothetical protein
MHTLFVREHNRLAKDIAGEYPDLSEHEIFELARMIVGAQMQVITYQEFLPILLGPGAIGPYEGYALNSIPASPMSSPPQHSAWVTPCSPPV